MEEQEQSQQVGTEVDLSGGEQPDPLADGLPPGVQPGELGGENPSEEPPEEEDEIVADPDERDASQDDEEYPADEAQAEAEAEEVEAEQEASTEVEGSPASDEEPEPEEKPKRKRATRKSRVKAQAGQRGYVILRAGPDPGTWLEAFERPDPKKDEPFVLMQRNSTAALRKAYRLLSEAEEEPQSYVLNAVPEKLWNPKAVAGRVHKQTAISVG